MITRKLMYFVMGMSFIIGQSASASDPASVYNTIPDDMGKLGFRSQSGPPGGKSIFYMKGYVYAYIPGDVECDPADGPCTGFFSKNPKRHGARLFGFEGYNVRSLTSHPDDDTLFYSSREIVFYTDMETGEVVTKWDNPFTGETVPVVPVMNEFMDGVRKTTRYASPGRPMEERGLNFASNADVFPNYNLREQYDQTDNMNVINNGQYTSAELFDFYTPKSAVAELKCADSFLQNPENDDSRNEQCPGGAEKWLDWAPRSTVSWTRIGPWLPWMGMSEIPTNSRYVPGMLVYHARSETMTQFEYLPADFRKKLKKWFDDGALGLNTIGYEAWKNSSTFEEYTAIQPYNNGKNDTTWSVFINKVLQPQKLTWQEWVDSGYPLPTQ